MLGGGTGWFRGVALCLSWALSACTAEDDHARARAALALPWGDVDCAPVTEALLRVRTQAEQAQADAMAAQMAANVPHDEIPVGDLVAYFVPTVGEGLPEEPSGQFDMKRVAAWILCDKLTREVVTRAYLADHPEHRQ